MIIQQMLLDPAFRSAAMLFFRLSMFQRFFQAPEDQGCKCFVHESDISNGTEVLGGSCVLRFGSVWNTAFCQDDGTSPVCSISFMMPRKAVTPCNNSATNPNSSEALLVFIRSMAPFNSCGLQFCCVSCNGRVRLPGSP